MHANPREQRSEVCWSRIAIEASLLIVQTLDSPIRYCSHDRESCRIGSALAPHSIILSVIRAAARTLLERLRNATNEGGLADAATCLSPCSRLPPCYYASRYRTWFAAPGIAAKLDGRQNEDCYSKPPPSRLDLPAASAGVGTASSWHKHASQLLSPRGARFRRSAARSASYPPSAKPIATKELPILPNLLILPKETES